MSVCLQYVRVSPVCICGLCMWSYMFLCVYVYIAALQSSFPRVAGLSSPGFPTLELAAQPAAVSAMFCAGCSSSCRINPALSLSMSLSLCQPVCLAETALTPASAIAAWLPARLSLSAAVPTPSLVCTNFFSPWREHSFPLQLGARGDLTAC